MRYRLARAWRNLAPPVFLVTTAAALAVVLLLAGRPPDVLTDQLIGLGGDPYQMLWRFAGLRDALAHGTLSIRGDPFRNLSPFPWLPLDLIAGQPLAYNLVWLLQAPLTAGAVYGLGRQLSLKPGLAGLAGILAAFSPYRLAQSLGHFGAMQLFWVPAVLACLLSWVRRPTLAKAVLGGLLFAATAWTEHTLFLTTVLASGVTTLVYARSVAAHLRHPRSWAAVSVVVLLVAAALTPFGTEIRRAATSASTINPGSAQRLRFSPPLRSLIGWPAFHATASGDEPYGTSSRSIADQVFSLGWTVPALAFVALCFGIRTNDRRAVVAVALVSGAGVALALAPRTVVGSSLLDHAPVLSAIRAYGRFLALPSIGLPLLAAYGVGRIGGRFTAWRPVIVPVLGMLLISDVLPRTPFPLQPGGVPAYAAELATEGRGAVLEAGAAVDYVLASRALYASAQHHRPVIGHIAFERVDDRAERERLLRVPVVRDLLLFRVEDLWRSTFFGQSPAAVARAALVSEGVSTVVVPLRVNDRLPLRVSPDGNRPVTVEELEAVRRFLTTSGFREKWSNGSAAVYHIPDAVPEGSTAIVIRREGWRRMARKSDGTVQAAVVRGAAFDVRVVGPAPARVSLSMRLVSPADASVGLTHLSSRARRFRSGDVIRFDLGRLTPGLHRLVLNIDADEIIVENPSVTQKAL